MCTLQKMSICLIHSRSLKKKKKKAVLLRDNREKTFPVKSRPDFKGHCFIYFIQVKKIDVKAENTKLN